MSIPYEFIEWVSPDMAQLWYPGHTRESDKRNYGGRGNRHAQDAWRSATGRRMPFKGFDAQSWTVCHVYAWAAKCPNHFSHTAGLVLVHPSYAWQTDQDDSVAGWLQAEAFVRFGYDPTGRFSGRPATSGCGDPLCQAEAPHFVGSRA
ncbi:MAG: hypothetical protein ACOC7P_03815 [Chloroflexota bacterium]